LFSKAAIPLLLGPLARMTNRGGFCCRLAYRYEQESPCLMQRKRVMDKPWNTQKDNTLQKEFMARHGITEDQVKRAGDDIRREREAGHVARKAAEKVRGR
jgi:hypothetical protein